MRLRNNTMSTSSPVKSAARCILARLVYFEVHADIEAAITREKQMKKWNWAWKVRLIGRIKPESGRFYPQIAKP